MIKQEVDLNYLKNNHVNSFSQRKLGLCLENTFALKFQFSALELVNPPFPGKPHGTSGEWRSHAPSGRAHGTYEIEKYEWVSMERK